MRQTKIAADDILIFLLLSFEENKAWFFMWNLCLAEDSLETSSLIFSEKTMKKYLWMSSAAVVMGPLGLVQTEDWIDLCYFITEIKMFNTVVLISGTNLVFIVWVINWSSGSSESMQTFILDWISGIIGILSLQILENFCNKPI